MCCILPLNWSRRLINSFQSNLAEITIIANPVHSAANMHRACQIQSFYDPLKCEGGGFKCKGDASPLSAHRSLLRLVIAPHFLP